MEAPKMAINAELDQIEKRQNRIEDAIERLTQISADLNKMLAVQEQRLTQQERSMGIIEEMVEKRREEYDKKIQNVYDVMRTEDNKILEELEEMRQEQKEQHKAISEKMSALEKIIWMYLGGFSVLVFLITYGPKILELLEK
jgi:DNA repair exonuclease SbcCD ATPase subunit